MVLVIWIDDVYNLLANDRSHRKAKHFPIGNEPTVPYPKFRMLKLSFNDNHRYVRKNGMGYHINVHLGMGGEAQWGHGAQKQLYGI